MWIIPFPGLEKGLIMSWDMNLSSLQNRQDTFEQMGWFSSNQITTLIIALTKIELKNKEHKLRGKEHMSMIATGIGK